MKLSDLGQLNALHKKLAELKHRKKILSPYKNNGETEKWILKMLDAEIKEIEDKILFL